MDMEANSLVLGSRHTVLMLLPLLLFSSCSDKTVYYRGSEVKVLGESSNGRQVTIKYKKTGITQEVKIGRAHV